MTTILTFVSLLLATALGACFVMLRQSKFPVKNGESHPKEGQEIREEPNKPENHELLLQQAEILKEAIGRNLEPISNDLVRLNTNQDKLASAILAEVQLHSPPLRRNELLSEISFEEFFEPPDLVIYEGRDSLRQSAWLNWLMGSSNFAVKAFDTYKTLTERYGEFSPELAQKLQSGTAKLMESTEGARWIVTEKGKVIGHGIMRVGATTAHGAASIFSSVTLASYMVVTKDTLKELRNIHTFLQRISDDSLWQRQARLEATYESLRRISMSAYRDDRGSLLRLIEELHQMRSYLRRKILAESPQIQEPGKLMGFFRRGESEEKRRVFFDKFRAELLQSHQIFRLEALAVTTLNDMNLERAFFKSLEEEAVRLKLMHTAMTQSWKGDKEYRELEEQPVILLEIDSMAEMYARGLKEANFLASNYDGAHEA